MYKRLNNFVVIGDGLQAYITALWLSRYTQGANINLVLLSAASPCQDFIIENSLLKMLGIEYHDFLKQVDASFHLSSKWVNQDSKEVFYHSSESKALSKNYAFLVRHFFQERTDKLHTTAFDATFMPQLNLCLSKQIIDPQKAPFPLSFHFCYQSFITYLKDIVLKRGVKLHRCKPKSIKEDEQGRVVAIQGCDIPSIDFTLFTSAQPLNSYSSALPFKVWEAKLATPNSYELSPYSLHFFNKDCQLMRFECPKNQQFHFRFPASLSDTQATSLLKKWGLKLPTLIQAKIPSYVQDRCWEGHKLYLGASCGQLCSLPVHYSLRLLEKQLRLLDRFFPNAGPLEEKAKHYTHHHQALWQSYKEFGALMRPPHKMGSLLKEYFHSLCKGHGYSFEAPKGLFTRFEIDAALFALHPLAPLSHPVLVDRKNKNEKEYLHKHLSQAYSPPLSHSLYLKNILQVGEPVS